MKQIYEKESRNLILFALGCIASLGSVLIYINLIMEELWTSLGHLATLIPAILLAGGFFTSAYFYRRSLP